jgi:hypothetical protein
LAKIALIEILRLPPRWRFHLKWLQVKLQCGKDKAKAVLREIERAGYMKRSQSRDERGRLGSTDYLFSDDPHLLSEQAEAPWADLPPTVEPPLINYTDQEDHRSARAARDQLSTPDSEGKSEHVPRALPEAVRRAGQAIMPGWDINRLWGRYLDWEGSRSARNPYKAFLGWLASIKRRAASDAAAWHATPGSSTAPITVLSGTRQWDVAVAYYQQKGYPLGGAMEAGRIVVPVWSELHDKLRRMT